MHFDWYQATIDDSPRHVVDAVATLGDGLQSAEIMARKYRYKSGFAIYSDVDGIIAHVLYGGNGDKPHAFSSGVNSQRFSNLVRHVWPDDHVVTRLDVAQDFNDSSAYGRIKKVARRIAKEHRMRFSSIEDELNKGVGRTQYIGSSTSEYRGRLYEKGLEQLAKLEFMSKGSFIRDNEQFIVNTVTGELVRPEDWVRLELQARPKCKEARLIAAKATPEQVWTFTDWSYCLAKEVFSLALERMYMKTRKISRDEEAIRWMCQQYGAVLGRVCFDLGGWDKLGQFIGEIVNLNKVD